MPTVSACRIDAVLDLISDTWTLALIHQMSAGPRRTLELKSAFSGLSSKTLSARLKRLQRHGIVARKSYSEAPPRVEYSLTDKGRDLAVVLGAVGEVAAAWDLQPDSRDETFCHACLAERGHDTRSPARVPKRSPARPRKKPDITLL